MITVDAKELMKLNAAFAQYTKAIPKNVAVKALRESIKPMFTASRNLAPIGNVVNYSGRPGMERGGATRRDVRIRFVKEEGSEIARVLVGVSSKSGKVGWRTHFITRGFTDRGGKFHGPDNFLQEAFDNTIDIVQDKFYRSLFDGFVKWGKENLPQ